MECLAVKSSALQDMTSFEEPMECGYIGSEVASSKKPPEQFSDASTIQAPRTLDDLVERLHDIFSGDAISVEYVQKLMASYKSNPKEWKKFAKFDQYRYTRNLVNEGNGKFNLMILCWNEAQGSSIHSHANSHCFLKVLDGQVKEEMFDWPDDNMKEENDNSGDEENKRTMKKCSEHVYDKNSCAYINDDLGLHRVENCSHMDKAVTLHLYSPPFDECDCFDERTGRATKSRVTFWSKYGKRTPFGRHPERSQNGCVAENN